MILADNNIIFHDSYIVNDVNFIIIKVKKPPFLTAQTSGQVGLKSAYLYITLVVSWYF